MEQLERGDKQVVGKKMSLLQLRAVSLMAAELGMDTRAEDNGEHVEIISPKGATTLPPLEELGEDNEALPKTTPGTSRKRTMKSLTGLGDEEEDAYTEEEQIKDFFDEMCTGWYNGQKMFTRLIDLQTLANDISEMMPGRFRKFKKLNHVLEDIFEDTIQLQVDFGTRTRKGLTRQWFPTFLQKVAKACGMTVFGLLLLVWPDDDD
jgi:hypothetical protein